MLQDNEHSFSSWYKFRRLLQFMPKPEMLILTQPVGQNVLEEASVQRQTSLSIESGLPSAVQNLKTVAAKVLADKRFSLSNVGSLTFRGRRVSEIRLFSSCISGKHPSSLWRPLLPPPNWTEASSRAWKHSADTRLTGQIF